MPDSSPCRKKKKLTIAATEKGVDTAERALIRLGFDSKSNFAESQRLSRSTVTNFFNQVPIQLDSFKKICDSLKLKWQQIAGITEDSINYEQIERSVNPSPDLEEGAKVKMLGRQVTVIDEQSRTIKSVIILKGEINSISNLRILATILRENGGDTIQIIDIQEGSIKLIIEGSEEDIERLLIQINSRELTELDGFPVQDAQILSETSEDDESSQQKWRLVEEIVTKQILWRDLSCANLSDADLRNACLTGADLSGADLSGADLNGANLSGAKLNGANLSGADLSRANLSRAKLSGADLSRADLSGTDLSGADLSGAKLNGANLIGANLRGADLSSADLRDANLSGANLNAANLSGADLSNAKLIRAKLIRANLSGANLRGTNLSDANLSDANLSDADLSDADLSRVYLSGADLRSANLRGAYLRGAYLRGAKFKGAKLKGADLKGAKLSLAVLIFVKLRVAFNSVKLRVAVIWFVLIIIIIVVYIIMLSLL
ncbi:MULTISPECIES: pentapeptide repeat-containing protein [unclassified Microcoleus]|uniref:pentapeptide repeat-containing protein n=1 Tax=unclassified Microcoleus TaxID=2642155 RepID=UPI002FCF07FB